MWLIENIAHAMPFLSATWDSGFYQTTHVFADAFNTPKEYR